MAKSNIIKEILQSLALGALLGGTAFSFVKYTDSKEKQAINAVKNHSKTIEYVVKENECWEQIGRRTIPEELRNKTDSRFIYEYLAKELNGRKDYALHKHEKVLVPVYDKN